MADTPYHKPGPIGVLADLVSRAIRGELDLPPWWLRDVGGPDFKQAGQEFRRLFIEVGRLQPHERVLDIGCGSGRMAIPLLDYLGQNGSYTGLDITPDSIRWCQEHITTKRSNFRFLHADLYNARYNPGGQHRAETYKFPLETGGFDFILLTSVFTHLLPEATQNYLAEIRRLLHPQGRAFVTFFLLNEAQQALAAQGRSQIDFKEIGQQYQVRDEIIPESAVAYEEAFLQTLVAQASLEVKEAHYGAWSGRSNGLSYQDILLLQPRL